MSGDPPVDSHDPPWTLRVAVPPLELGYPVMVGSGLLDRLGPQLRAARPDVARAALVSDDTVMGLYGARAANSLAAQGIDVVRFAVSPGEGSKSPDRLQWLVGELIAGELSRRDVVVALGGGVVGDLAGLAAALCMRGLPVVQCPTSLLAQVDASVGGKVAVDLPQGKNLLGTFHFPIAVLIDPAVLASLPERELAAGAAEMLKHALLFSPDHLRELVDAGDALRARDEATLARLVAVSVELKAACVAGDPWERQGPGVGRALLNLGHTVGHALERVSGYELRHGEAVGLGLRAAARVSERASVAGPGLEQTVTRALERLALPTDLDAWLARGRDVLASALRPDKKRAFGKITYIALRAPGEPVPLSLTPEEIVALLRPAGRGG